MTRFIRHEFDVLVCTTIIGSGLDIPNANTIVIDRADRFGLAELYQIRGRVGRYKHRAFAYLLVPGDRALTREAQERLKALEEFSTLGAGFRVAMRDLEIRGAGNILGAQQSGHIAAVGFETYNELIAEAVAEAKGEPVKVFHLPAFDINTDAYIPDDYVEIESQKITLYKRISSLRSQEEIDDMVEELNDRFGPPPESVRRLLEVMEVRVLGSEIGARKLYASKEQLTVEFDSKHYLEKANQPSVSHAFGERLRFAWQEQPSIICSLNGDDPVALGKRLMTALQEA